MSAVAAPLPRPPKFGYVHLERCVADIVREATSDSDLDRRAVLARACVLLGAEEAVLRRRGFDRAYRRLIEGV